MCISNLLIGVSGPKSICCLPRLVGWNRKLTACWGLVCYHWVYTQMSFKPKSDFFFSGQETNFYQFPNWLDASSSLPGTGWLTFIIFVVLDSRAGASCMLGMCSTNSDLKWVSAWLYSTAEAGLTLTKVFPLSYLIDKQQNKVLWSNNHVGRKDCFKLTIGLR